MRIDAWLIAKLTGQPQHRIQRALERRKNNS
jgi:hypothetical protein